MMKNRILNMFIGDRESTTCSFLQLRRVNVIFLFLSCNSCFNLFAQEKANILVICTDQAHPGIVGYRGNTVIKTPNIDKLAADGVYFTRTYVSSPVSGPSRASYMTGKYIHQIEYWYNAQAWPTDAVLWSHRVTDNGYYTGHFGKMDSPDVYGELGFDEEWHSMIRKATNIIEPDKRFLPENQRKAKGHLAVKTFKLEDYSEKEKGKFGQYALDRPTTDRTLKFLKERKVDGKPWMLHVGYLMPHWPYTLPQKYFDMYAEVDIPMPHDANFPNLNMHPALQYFQKWDGLDVTPDQNDFKKALRAYYGMVTCIDDMVGEIITQLKESGMYENTYIIFTSDHGDNLGEHGLMGNKHTAMEGSVSVPLIIAGPNVNKGTKVDMPTALIDLYPTIMDMADIKYTDPEMPGCSLLPVVQGKKNSEDRIILSEWHGVGFPGAWYMLVNKKYKYIYYERDRPSLFDIESDPQEMNDLALDPAYSNMLTMFENELNKRLDPVATAIKARIHQKLITNDGKDLMFDRN